ncbi:hypothetical protein PT974_07770 [Cladobotryum mycophilum]|uniref:Cyanovirin-N domain-containing protein n=1 Tax=Cladobotryum mycophilum TaxID=491253 RepID=A0ABR0SHW6_9HYPO
MPGFGTSVRNLRLGNFTIDCEARRRNGSWVFASLGLNEHLENRDGDLVVGGRNAWHTSDQDSWRLNGTILSGRLQRRDGNTMRDASIDLNLYISNEDGVLKFDQV